MLRDEHFLMYERWTGIKTADWTGEHRLRQLGKHQLYLPEFRPRRAVDIFQPSICCLFSLVNHSDCSVAEWISCCTKSDPRGTQSWSLSTKWTYGYRCLFSAFFSSLAFVKSTTILLPSFCLHLFSLSRCSLSECFRLVDFCHLMLVDDDHDWIPRASVQSVWQLISEYFHVYTHKRRPPACIFLVVLENGPLSCQYAHGNESENSREVRGTGGYCKALWQRRPVLESSPTPLHSFVSWLPLWLNGFDPSCLECAVNIGACVIVKRKGTASISSSAAFLYAAPHS